MSTETTDEKRTRLKEMLGFHKGTFDSLGITNPLFIPKLSYRPKEITSTEPHIAYFASEVAKGQDIYTEFANSDNIPQDSERRLYKWRYNPNYKEEYHSIETNGIVRYFIPTAELILIKTNSPEILVQEHVDKSPQVKIDFLKQLDDTSPVKKDDIPLSEATLRDLAAILLKTPVSNKEWLNNIIKEQ